MPTAPPPGGDSGSTPLTRLGKYIIRGELGRGAMGVVYRADDTVMQRPVALKLLPAATAADPRSLQRFLHEARSAGKVQHGNTVAVLDVGCAEGVHYLAMEFVDGENCEQLLERQGPPDWQEATRIAADACRGLAAAHAAGVIHRDIKPANIMRARNGQVKLADFGVARNAAAALNLTATGIVMGTPLYMSPEQARGEEVDHRTDVYSLGASYYALLTGRPAYADTEAAAVEVMRAHCSDPVPDPRDARTDIPAPVAHVIRRAMAKKPSDRYESAKEFLLALESVAAGGPEPGRKQGSSRTPDRPGDRASGDPSRSPRGDKADRADRADKADRPERERGDRSDRADKPAGDRSSPEVRALVSGKSVSVTRKAPDRLSVQRGARPAGTKVRSLTVVFAVAFVVVVLAVTGLVVFFRELGSIRPLPTGNGGNGRADDVATGGPGGKAVKDTPPNDPDPGTAKKGGPPSKSKDDGAGIPPDSDLPPDRARLDTLVTLGAQAADPVSRARVRADVESLAASVRRARPGDSDLIADAQSAAARMPVLTGLTNVWVQDFEDCADGTWPPAAMTGGLAANSNDGATSSDAATGRRSVRMHGSADRHLQSDVALRLGVPPALPFLVHLAVKFDADPPRSSGHLHRLYVRLQQGIEPGPNCTLWGLDLGGRTRHRQGIVPSAGKWHRILLRSDVRQSRRVVSCWVDGRYDGASEMSVQPGEQGWDRLVLSAGTGAVHVDELAVLTDPRDAAGEDPGADVPATLLMGLWGETIRTPGPALRARLQDFSRRLGGGHEWDRLLGAAASHLAERMSSFVADAGNADYRLQLGGGRFVRSLSFSPDGTLLAAACNAGFVRIWALADRREVMVLRHAPRNERKKDGPPAGEWVAFRPDGKVLATAASDGTIMVWSVADWKPIATLQHERWAITPLVWHPDRDEIYYGTEDGHGWSWKPDRPGGRPERLTSLGNWVTSADWLPQAGAPVFASDRGQVKVGDRVVQEITNNFGFVRVAPGAATAATTADGGCVRMWNLAELKVEHELPVRGVRAVAFTPSARHVLTAGTGFGVRVFRTGKPSPEVVRLLGPEQRVHALEVSGDGKWIAAGGDDGVVFLWRTETVLPEAAAPARTPAGSVPKPKQKKVAPKSGG